MSQERKRKTPTQKQIAEKLVRHVSDEMRAAILPPREALPPPEELTLRHTSTPVEPDKSLRPLEALLAGVSMPQIVPDAQFVPLIVDADSNAVLSQVHRPDAQLAEGGHHKRTSCPRTFNQGSVLRRPAIHNLFKVCIRLVSNTHCSTK